MAESVAARVRVWMVAICAAFITFATLGMSRSAGVLFVEVVNIFQLTREQGAWPFAVQASVMAFAGILPSFLETFLSIRQILFIGAGFAVTGIGLGFFAASYGWLIFTYGGLFGFGFALLVPSAVVTVNRHFKNYRATANGIMWAGDSIALFTMPPLLNYLIDLYGLRGALLIVSGMFFNLFWVIYIMMRFGSTTQTSQSMEDHLTNGPKKTSVHEYDPLLTKETIVTITQTSLEYTSIQHASQECSSLSKDKNQVVENHQAPTCLFEVKAEKEQDRCTKVVDSEVLQTMKHRIFIVAKKVGLVFMHPMFLLVTTIHLFYSFIIILYCIVIFDHALNIGIPRSSAVFITTVFASMELIGRVGCGWVTDMGIFKRRTVIIVCQVGASVMLLCHALFTHEAILFTATAVLGFFSGVCFALSNVMYVELLGFQNLITCVGLKNTIIGCLSFLRPKIIGFSKDTLGSYVPMLYLLTGLSLLFGLLWFFQPSEHTKQTTIEEES